MWRSLCSPRPITVALVASVCAHLVGFALVLPARNSASPQVSSMTATPLVMVSVQAGKTSDTSNKTAPTPPRPAAAAEPTPPPPLDSRTDVVAESHATPSDPGRRSSHTDTSAETRHATVGTNDVDSEWTSREGSDIDRYMASESYTGYQNLIRDRIYANKHYPFRARKAGMEGVVELAFLITPQGALESLEVTEASRYPVLTGAARRAVKRAAPFPPFPPDAPDTPLPFTASLSFALRN